MDKKLIKTTAGRVLFNTIWPKEIGFYNEDRGQEAPRRDHPALLPGRRPSADGRCARPHEGAQLRGSDQVGRFHRHRRHDHPGRQGHGDQPRPTRSISVVEKQYRSGAITDGERYNKIVDVWTQANDEISNMMMRTLEHNHGRSEFNPVFIMADSGARGNKNQVRQLAGMRGLMAKPSGEIIERPIVSNFREGLTVSGILHLHARRPQGSGRHGAQDRRLRLHDAQAPRRGAGRDHQRGGLRHGQRHLGQVDPGRRGRDREADRAHRRPRLVRGHQRSRRAQADRQERAR